ncbi:MAG: CHAD domain-containing protein [Gemmobacter sp.]|jgi:CHAD domain-containing protein|nr:CHAD domain-containing protein [Gemmobacter sp.]
MISYRFDLADTSLTESLRRIALAEIAPVRHRLSESGALDPGTVHDIRKRMKRLRALLRLLRSGLPRIWPAENMVLREAARGLSEARDGATRLASFDRIAHTEASPALGALRAQFVAEAALQAGPPDDLGGVLEGLALRIEGWQVRGADRHVLEDGLARTRARTRAAMRAARDHVGAGARAEALHDWRKRAKDFWYQARLFQPAWPEAMKPIVAEAGRLGELLGDHHDLAVLTAHVAALPESDIHPEARVTIAERSSEAMLALEAEAFPLGARLFAGDPEEMASLWVKWWRLWRAQVA